MADWLLRNISSDTAEIARALNVSEVVARLIVNRGIKSYEDARLYLTPVISGLSPALEISGVKEAADCLLKHIANGAKIAVYGDYDVDGVMSAVILQKSLKALSADFVYYVPNRESEGYGLNAPSVLELAAAGVSLIIACDNGISALNEAELIYQKGMELIIIDHHEPYCDETGEEVLPKAEAIINPKIKNCRYPFKQMCAAGLCYRFATGLFETAGRTVPDHDDLLIFAALATVCDIVDLLGDNRVIVKNGLSKIKNTKNHGLLALINTYGLTRITAFHFGFILGPAINASGRLESARTAVELFLTNDDTEAANIAKKLYELNISRRNMTEDAYRRLNDILADKTERERKVYVLYYAGVHESVAGIAAGRIKESFNHPAIVITDSKDCAKGSARSIEGYNIYEALSECSELFIKFGGHSQAAGFSLPHENIGTLRKLLNERCELDSFIPKLHIDMRLPLSRVNFELCRSLEVMEPFGKGNKEPVFAETNVIFKRVDFIGKEKNIVKLWLRDYPSVAAISFDGYEKFLKIAKQKLGIDDKTELLSVTSLEMDIAYVITINEYRGESSIQLILKDFR